VENSVHDHSFGVRIVVSFVLLVLVFFVSVLVLRRLRLLAGVPVLVSGDEVVPVESGGHVEVPTHHLEDDPEPVQPNGPVGVEPRLPGHVAQHPDQLAHPVAAAALFVAVGHGFRRDPPYLQH
jgi:hypothetical protein